MLLLGAGTQRWVLGLVTSTGTWDLVLGAGTFHQHWDPALGTGTWHWVLGLGTSTVTGTRRDTGQMTR